MTPQEKAVSLVDWFMATVGNPNNPLEASKQCAVKVCEEARQASYIFESKDYWNQVIEHIKAIR